MKAGSKKMSVAPQVVPQAGGNMTADERNKMAVSFLEARKQRFLQRFEEAASYLRQPPSETSVVLRLGTALGKFSSFNELQKLWDRDGDGRISKKEFHERVGSILSLKLTQPQKKELDALFETMDEDGGGVLEIAEMQPGIEKLKARSREELKRLKFLTAYIPQYKAELDDVQEALTLNVETIQAEADLLRRKENIPLPVQIGEGLTGATAAALMKNWDR